MTDKADLKCRLMVLESVNALPDHHINRAFIGETATEALQIIKAQAAEVARLREAMAYIATYPAKGTARRTRQGYPAEILYDEFAYKRMVDSYRDYARAALEAKP